MSYIDKIRVQNEDYDIKDTALAEEVDALKLSKVNLQQDATNAGKMLIVGDDGNLKLGNLPVITRQTELSNVAYVRDGSDILPLKKCVVNVKPFQSGSGDPSPTNIRPITGWTGANITRCGKNLLDPERYLTSRVTVDGDSLVCKSSAYYSSIFTPNTGTKPIDISRALPIPVGTLTISCESIVSNTEGGSATLYVYTCDAGGDNKTNRGKLNAETLQVTFTMDAPGYFDLQMSSNTARLTITKLQLEVGDTATAYEAWNGVKAASDWSATAGAVYGGTADLTDGTLVSECAVTTIGALTWTYYDDANGKYFRTRIYGIPGVPNKTGSDAYLVSSAYKTVLPRIASIIDMPDCSIKENRYNTSPYGEYIYLRDLRFTTEADLKAAMGDVKIVYKKATSDSYSVDPAAIDVLLGANLFSADAGDIAIEYVADTKLYIDGEANKSSMIASSGISESRYFQIGDELYYSTTAISAGETIVPGTNCIKTTIAEALNELLA